MVTRRQKLLFAAEDADRELSTLLACIERGAHPQAKAAALERVLRYGRSISALAKEQEPRVMILWRAYRCRKYLMRGTAGGATAVENIRFYAQQALAGRGSLVLVAARTAAEARYLIDERHGMKLVLGDGKVRVLGVQACSAWASAMSPNARPGAVRVRDDDMDLGNLFSTGE